LSKSGFTGGQALNHCATGYHFASFAELSDPSALTYNSTLGRTAPDAGSGPPSTALGWVRSGNSASGTTIPTNCNLWSSSSSSDSGSSAITAPYVTSSVTTTDTGTIIFQFIACNVTQPVWCVQN
jgi:hypothetical protein